MFEATSPTLQVQRIQAPVFHGYSFSAWVEFESNPGLEALENGLALDLIEVRGADGWRWRSSLTREDTGAGACELVWVERIAVR